MANRTEIIKELTEIFRDIFMRDDLVLTPETTADDVAGWDSFKQIEILLAVKERFGVKLRTRELDQLDNVGDLVTVIESKAEG